MCKILLNYFIYYLYITPPCLQFGKTIAALITLHYGGNQLYGEVKGGRKGEMEEGKGVKERWREEGKRRRKGRE